jgi:hypothetical protein
LASFATPENLLRIIHSGVRPREKCGHRVRVGRCVAAPILKTTRPRNLAVPGPNWGVGVRHALFPGYRHWARCLRRLPAPRRHSSRQAKVSVS